ncbi:MAG: MFS transporter [Phycisphaerales bacterium]
MTTAPTARLSLMMFLQFFVWGAWYVSMTGWMNAAGISGLTGWAYTVGPIAALISPFFLGMVADRFFATQRVLGVLHMLGGVALLAVPGVVAAANQPAPDAASASITHPYILLLLAHMLCYMPTLGLTNTLCFHHMSDPAKQFPVVRVFGTIGWIVGNIVVGGSLDAWGLKGLTWIAEGDKSPMQFFIAGGAGVALGLFSFALPHTPPPAAGTKASVRQVLGLDSLRLLARPGYAVFILCSFLICIPLAGYYGWGRSFVDHVGFSNATLTMSYGQMSEIVFMLLMPLCFARLGFKWMLAAGMAAWIARYGLFSAAAADKVIWMTLIGVILHGICYDFFFVTGFIYVDKQAPKEIRGQAQGFLVLVTQGLGLGLGAQLFARLSARYTKGEGSAAVVDWGSIWLVPCIFAAVVLVLFVVTFRNRRAGI